MAEPRHIVAISFTEVIIRRVTIVAYQPLTPSRSVKGQWPSDKPELKGTLLNLLV